MITVVHSATYARIAERDLVVPRIAKMNSAPTSGRKVTSGEDAASRSSLSSPEAAEHIGDERATPISMAKA